jgi:hypothetical protein
MVSKDPADLQRRHSDGAPENMRASDFFHVAAKPTISRGLSMYPSSDA